MEIFYAGMKAGNASRIPSRWPDEKFYLKTGGRDTTFGDQEIL